MYNYRDYRLYNPTEQTFQFAVWLDDRNLNGELRAEHALETSFHIREEEAWFRLEADGNWYRHNKIYRRTVDKKTGRTLRDEMLLENHSRVLYDPSFIPEEKRRPPEDANG